MVKKENAPADVTSIDRGKGSDNIDNYNIAKCDPATIIEITGLVAALNAKRDKTGSWAMFQRTKTEDLVTFFDKTDEGTMKYLTYTTSTLFNDETWIHSPGLISARDELRRRVNNVYSV